MPSGRVTYAHAPDGVHVLRYHGRVDYMLAPAIKRFTDGLIAQGGIHGWIFDLTDAQILDSTNLGLMARMVAKSRSRGEVPSVIVSTHDDMTGVLRSMSFDEMFQIVTVAPPESPTSAAASGEAEPEVHIDGEPASPGELGETMLDAHRVLMTLSDATRQQFKDVVDCLEADAAPGK